MKLFNIFLIAAVAAFADPLAPRNFIAPNETAQQNDADLKQNNFRLGLDPKEIEEVQKKDEQVQDAFNYFTNKEINYQPIIMPISSHDKIFLHHYFTTTILLPSGAIVSYVDTSTQLGVLKHENNTLLLRPNADFKIANITIIYKLNGTNYVMNILASRYEKTSDEKINLIYSYVDVKKRSDLEIISIYIETNKEYPKNKYSYINIDGITYRIVEDEIAGKAFVNGKKYRVDNNVIYK